MKKLYSITVSKLIAATPNAIWATWSNPEQYAAVHGSYKVDIDFRVGGSARVTYFENKDAGETLEYLEIVTEQKLVFCWKEAEQYYITLLLVPQGTNTKVSLTQNCHDNPEWINTSVQGWAWVLDSLALYLKSGKGINYNDWIKEQGTYKLINT